MLKSMRPAEPATPANVGRPIRGRAEGMRRSGYIDKIRRIEMLEETVSTIHRTMDYEAARDAYPEGYPALPDLPTSRYKDRDFEKSEMKLLWKKTWLLAGLDSDLPETGAYFLFEHVGQSVIVSRGKDGVVRAFHNNCRHRSSALLEQPKGKVGRFTCPYHAWSYSLEGKLVAVPEEYDFACLKREKRGLITVRCESWNGLIFVNLDPTAGSLADFMRSANTSTDGFPMSGLVTKRHFHFELECNWKLAYHNFLEAYHVRSVHPSSLAPYLDLKTWVPALLENGHVRYVSRKRRGASLYQGDFSESGEKISGIFNELLITLSTFPNNFIALDPSGFAIQTFWPLTIDRSLMDVRLVGWDSSPGTDDYWSTLRDRVTSIVSEDKHLFGSIQRNVDAGFSPAITVGYQERAVYWFEQEVDRQMGVENVPAEMRVPPVLSKCQDG
jgi:phenylpropionate dioxygenase-like ring-hydroxylating dioxygenase large terminal subunit